MKNERKNQTMIQNGIDIGQKKMGERKRRKKNEEKKGRQIRNNGIMNDRNRN